MLQQSDEVLGQKGVGVPAVVACPNTFAMREMTTSPLPLRDRGLARLIGAGGKINFFPAFPAGVFFVEFIGKNFFGFAAFGAAAGKRFKMFELFKTGAVFWGTHDDILLFDDVIIIPKLKQLNCKVNPCVLSR